MKKTALLVCLLILSACSPAIEADYSSIKLNSTSSMATSSDYSSDVISESSKTENISVNPFEFQTEFSEEERVHYIDVLSNYGMMYNTEYNYFAAAPLSLFYGDSWENIDDFNINYLLSWRISLSFRDRETNFKYPAEEFETLAMTYFDVTVEEMRDQNLGGKTAAPMYHPEVQAYYLEAFGWGSGALPEIKLDSVDSTQEGFLTLYYTLSYPTEMENGEKFRRSASHREILRIKYSTEGGYHYISCIENTYPISDEEESTVWINTDSEESLEAKV